jgi:hypothetical protein
MCSSASGGGAYAGLKFGSAFAVALDDAIIIIEGALARAVGSSTILTNVSRPDIQAARAGA